MAILTLLAVVLHRGLMGWAEESECNFADTFDSLVSVSRLSESHWPQCRVSMFNRRSKLLLKLSRYQCKAYNSQWKCSHWAARTMMSPWLLFLWARMVRVVGSSAALRWPLFSHLIAAPTRDALGLPLSEEFNDATSMLACHGAGRWISIVWAASRRRAKFTCAASTLCGRRRDRQGGVRRSPR